MDDLKYCKDMLGLWFNEPDSKEDKYIHAFSFDVDILINMINTNIKDNEKHLYSIEPVKIYCLTSIIIKKTDEESCILHRIDDNFLFKNIYEPIYGFNKLSSNHCEQVLLIANKNDITETIENHGISANPIYIDTFYEESILNA